MENRAIKSIMVWLKCSMEDAKSIFNGVYRMQDGNNYSAFYDNDGKLRICKNGFLVHRINHIDFNKS